MSIDQHIPSIVLGPVDGGTCTAIIRLHQKLKDLHAELSAKLWMLKSGDEEKYNSVRKQITMLANEVELALQSIEVVVNMVASEAPSNGGFLQTRHEQERLRAMVITKAEAIDSIDYAKELIKL